jgi:hypothetical protein
MSDPIWVSSSSGSPVRIFEAVSVNLLTNSS